MIQTCLALTHDLFINGLVMLGLWVVLDFATLEMRCEIFFIYIYFIIIFKRIEREREREYMNIIIIIIIKKDDLNKIKYIIDNLIWVLLKSDFIK